MDEAKVLEAAREIARLRDEADRLAIEAQEISDKADRAWARVEGLRDKMQATRGALQKAVDEVKP